MEGKRGEPRNKPPFPTQSGYLGKPTVINNVETLVHTYTIFKYGAKKFYDLGVQYSRGTKLFSVSGDTPKPGIYELELGMSLQDFVYEFGKEIHAIEVKYGKDRSQKGLEKFIEKSPEAKIHLITQENYLELLEEKLF